MEVQTWIIGQIAIDIIIAILILWFIGSHFKVKKSVNDKDSIFQEPEMIISEMRQISQELDKNLKEKREISQQILVQLDEGLRKADETFRQVQKIIKEFGSAAHPKVSLKDTVKTRESVNALLAKGLSRGEVAQHLGISIGEIELLIKLQDRIKAPGPMAI